MATTSTSKQKQSKPASAAVSTKKTVKSAAHTKFKKYLEGLLQLQDVYTQLNDLEEEIEILNKQTQLEEQKYQSKQKQYENNLLPLKKVEDDVKTLEVEISKIQEKIEKCEDTKKKIKTIKEFKAINKEIDFLNQQNAIKENQLLSKKDEVTFRKLKLEKIEESLNEIKLAFDKKKVEFMQLLNERKEDIKKAQHEKSQVEKKVDTESLAIFTRIYKNKSYLAVVGAGRSTHEENLVCQGCYMLLPRQVEIVLKSATQIYYCPFCSRILYHDDLLQEK